MKVFIRRLKGMWANWYQREKLRKYLNELGFYVLSKEPDALDVYVVRSKTFLERWFL